MLLIISISKTRATSGSFICRIASINFSSELVGNATAPLSLVPSTRPSRIISRAALNAGIFQETISIKIHNIEVVPSDQLLRFPSSSISPPWTLQADSTTKYHQPGYPGQGTANDRNNIKAIFSCRPAADIIQPISQGAGCPNRCFAGYSYFWKDKGHGNGSYPRPTWICFDSDIPWSLY